MSESNLEKAIKEISKDIDTLKTLKEKLNSIFDKSRESDNELNFQKVQIIASHQESWFNFLSGIAAGGLILLISASLTIYYTFGVLYGYISFGLTVIGGVYIVLHMKGEHRKQLEKINGLMIRAENEASLPSIIELESSH